jgi:hypothetical protein
MNRKRQQCLERSQARLLLINLLTSRKASLIYYSRLMFNKKAALKEEVPRIKVI